MACKPRSALRRGLFAGALALTAAAVALPAAAADDDEHGRWRESQRSKGLPDYEVVPSWPKQLPNNWIIGQVAGVAVDRYDQIWVLHRPRSNTVDELGAAQDPPRSECCFPAPPVLAFNRQGDLLKHWGGDGNGFNWPLTEHGIWVDQQDNIWIGGNAATDRQVLKFSNDGQFLLQIGMPSSDPLDSSRTDILGQVASLTVDDSASEVYLADGYGNKRVVGLRLRDRRVQATMGRLR